MIANLRQKINLFILKNFISGRFFCLFLLIIFVAFIFRFWGLGQADFLSDDGHYAFRSLGWFDYLGSSQQTAPIQWFNQIPWWANLSFHDHPPLLFFFQWLGFWLFGPNAFAARFFIALLSFISVIFMYFLIKRSFGFKLALGATFLFSISTYAVWISRQSLNDGLVLSFGIICFYFFSEYFIKLDKKYLLASALFTGLAILSKYTAAYILPAMFLYIFFYHRKVLKTREFYGALLIFILVILPILIYNFFVFIKRGHFDASLSHMLGLRPSDFEIIKNKVVNFNIISNFKTEIVSVFSFSSPVYFFLKISALGNLFIKLFLKKLRGMEAILFCFLIAMLFMFIFMGPIGRYISIIEPFLIIAVIILIADLLNFFKKRNLSFFKKVFFVFWTLVLIFELIFSINTNLTNFPLSNFRFGFASDRSYNYGFNQLDYFIAKNIYPNEKFRRPTKLGDMKFLANDFKDKSVIIYDDRISWFATIWIFNRHVFYAKQPVFSLSQIVQFTGDANKTIKEMKDMGAKDFWLVIAVDKKTYDSNAGNYSGLEGVLKNTEINLQANGLKPYKIINNSNEIAFKIYNFN